jgi:hypothetical protein
MLLTIPRDLYAPVRIMLGQLTFRRSGRIAVVTGGAMDTHEDKQRRDPEDRVIDDCNQEQRRDKAMDKTLADNPESRLFLFGLFAERNHMATPYVNRGLISKSSWMNDRSPNDS